MLSFGVLRLREHFVHEWSEVLLSFTSIFRLAWQFMLMQIHPRYRITPVYKLFQRRNRFIEAVRLK